MEITRELVDHIGHNIISTLGKGLFGTSYLLDDESVLKITIDLQEIQCVPKITDMEAWNLTPHLPFIKQYGWHRSPVYPGGNIFYYIREITLDLHIDIDHQLEGWIESIKNPIENIETILGCAMSDDAIDPSNWGLRITDGELVWRDLSCRC